MSIANSVLLFVLLLELALVAQVISDYVDDDFDDIDYPDPIRYRYVDNELCERFGVICGRDNGTLRRTRCCQVIDGDTGRVIRHDCCNPELSGLIGGVVGGVFLIIILAGWVFICYKFCQGWSISKPTCICTCKCCKQNSNPTDMTNGTSKTTSHNDVFKKKKESEKEREVAIDLERVEAAEQCKQLQESSYTAQTDV